jgi:hypothetical protein
LLVSLGRPVNRFVAAKHQMREAEEGPQAEILAKFAEVHGHEWIRRNFEQFRHVIFDFMGDYYAAIPLGMTEEGRKRAPQAASKVDESTLMLTNLFAGLEQGRIFQRSMLLGVWPISAIVRRKLRKQGSVFADAGAFRFYRFKDRAWPEMILGAVMGAARDHRDELDEKRQRERQLWQAERDAEQAKAEALRAKAEADAQRVRAEAEAVKARAEEERALAELRRLEAELARKQLEDRQRAVERAINDPEPPSHRPVPPAPANGRPPRMQAAHETMPARAHGSPRVEPVMPGLRVIPEPAAAMPSQPTVSRASSGTVMLGGMANVATAAVLEPEPVPSFEFPVARPVVAVKPIDMSSGGLGETVAMASRSDNVLPMPPRSERTGTPEALPFADGPAQASVPAGSVDPVEGQPPAAESRTATSTEIGELLKGVAVSQYHVAQDIAAAAHELSQGQRAEAWRAARARAEAAAGPLAQDQLTARPAGVPVVDIQSGEIVREKAVWQAAGHEFEAEQRAALEGRHDAYRDNDDAGPMAQRLAPRLRPGK